MGDPGAARVRKGKEQRERRTPARTKNSPRSEALGSPAIVIFRIRPVSSQRPWVSFICLPRSTSFQTGRLFRFDLFPFAPHPTGARKLSAPLLLLFLLIYFSSLLYPSISSDLFFVSVIVAGFLVVYKNPLARKALGQ